jgi:hypothetical protein
MSGPASGIYAVTRIETDPGMMAEDPAEKQYWTGEDGPDQAIRVRMTVLKRLINKPVLKTNILGIDGLSGLSILRNWQQTNYPVSAGEWDLLSRLL